MPELLISNWYVLVAPAGTPRAIISRLNAETAKIVQSPETRRHLATIGGDPVTGTPEQAAEFLRGEHERWGQVIRDAGIHAD
jgi:tripartite-type tricarboxylate transporter receptor subunit TctC